MDILSSLLASKLKILGGVQQQCANKVATLRLSVIKRFLRGIVNEKFKLLEFLNGAF